MYTCQRHYSIMEIQNIKLTCSLFVSNSVARSVKHRLCFSALLQVAMVSFYTFPKLLVLKGIPEIITS